MTVSIQKIHEQIEQMQFYRLQNPLIEIEVYRNKFIVHYQSDMGQRQTLTHQASPVFANSRMILADFEKALLNVSDIFAKIPQKWYLGKPTILVNVKEELVDGLTSLESRALTELFARYGVKVIVFYQDKLFFTEILDERELKNAKQK